MPIPILFLGDSPSLPTGLGRIGRDLASQTARLPQFRVGYLGRGGMADRRLPFMQYTFKPSAESQWGETWLAEVWHNFSAGERGIIFTIYDPSRLAGWFVDPPLVAGYESLHQLLRAGNDRIERWGYMAVDSAGAGREGALTGQIAATVAGFDRVLAYSRFGLQVLRATLAAYDDRPVRGADDDAKFCGELDWAPHGINTRVFAPQDRMEARCRLAALAGWPPFGESSPIIGCVMTNQERKDWGLWAATCQSVRQLSSYGDLATIAAAAMLIFWAHTDSIDRYWDLRRLAADFGIADCTVVTCDTASDAEMSWRYSACDVTFLPSLGEGFGYPIAESLACGVPVIHGESGAGSELIPAWDRESIIAAHGYRLDTRWNIYRPLYRAEDFARQIVCHVGQRKDTDAARYAESVAHLDWRRLWPSVWERWMLRGIESWA